MVGTAKRQRFTMSEVGVTIAETTKMISTAQRKWRHRKRGVTRPIAASRTMRIGNSNIRPSPRTIVIRKLK
jgi:hypothetical protein